MTLEQNKAIVRGMINICFSGRDLSRQGEFLHPDFINHQEIFPLKNKKGLGVLRSTSYAVSKANHRDMFGIVVVKL